MLDDSDDLSDVLSEVLIRFLAIFCAFLSILGVFSGLPTTRQIREQRSTRHYRFLPYLTGQIYNLIWFYINLYHFISFLYPYLSLYYIFLIF